MTAPSLEVVQTGERSYRIRGEIDLATIGSLTDPLRHATAREGDLILELEELRFTDSTGLKELIKTAQALEGRGRLILTNPGDPIKRFFELAGLERIPNIEVRNG